MSQTSEGALKLAAKKIGINYTEYISLISQGYKWCYSCKEWHANTSFGIDRSRYDGLASICKNKKRYLSSKKYVNKPKQRYIGRKFVTARDGDKKQARRRVNYLIRIGVLQNPNNLPCIKCGHLYSDDYKRHEYHHYNGYTTECHEIVEVLCSKCHHQIHI